MLRVAARAAALAALLLAGCATLQAPPPAERLYAGRFAATSEIGVQRENLSGRFTLSVHRDGLTLDLASPLGNTLARVQSFEGSATLVAPQSDGSLLRLAGADAEALLRDHLGWSLPVAGLPSWIEGQAAPGRPARDEGSDAIVQDGWTIRVLERFEASAPRRIEMRRAATIDAPAVTLRLVLDAPGARP
jgi:outer membrane lipoprotein LolB